jgi:hypothetical protein
MLLCSQGRSVRMTPDVSGHAKCGDSPGTVPFIAGCSDYFFGTTASLQALATRNFTTVFAGILIEAPV